MKIEYVKKEKLYPYFGFAYPSENRIEIREDLPDKVKKFITQHETYHITDKAKNVLWRELKANFYGLRKEPIGALQTFFISLNFERLQLYVQRFKEKK